MIEALGPEKAEAWARGLVANFAQPPRGGDTDQLKALAAGVCDVAIANTYYFGRMTSSSDAAIREIASKIAVFWPNQAADDRGVHVNVSEYPIVPGSPVSQTLKSFGEFKADDIPLTRLGENNRAALQLMDRAGWK